MNNLSKIKINSNLGNANNVAKLGDIKDQYLSADLLHIKNYLFHEFKNCCYNKEYNFKGAIKANIDRF